VSTEKMGRKPSSIGTVRPNRTTTAQ
jgi:hypothetical protein